MQTLNKGIAMQGVKGMLFLTLMTGCAEWNSVPVVVDENFGRAVNNMVKNQTLCPEHGLKAIDPALCPEHGPVMGMDGVKAQGVINAYRTPVLEPIEKSKEGVKFDVKNVGAGSN